MNEKFKRIMQYATWVLGFVAVGILIYGIVRLIQ